MHHTDHPQIKLIANIWSTGGYPSFEKEWTMQERVENIKKQGFDGVTWFGTDEMGKLLRDHGLELVGYFSSANAADFGRLIEENLRAGAEHINVQLGDDNTPMEVASTLAVLLIAEAKRQGAKCSVEVHRDTATETPEKTYTIADTYQKVTGELLPITWDYSHLAVIKHLLAPFWERLLIRPDLVQFAQQFHLRPFNGHHCQLPVTDGKGNLSRECLDWIPFVEKLFVQWLDNPHNHRCLYAVPEMGPVPGGYNVTGWPHSWEDAVRLKSLLKEIWEKALAQKKA